MTHHDDDTLAQQAATLLRREPHDPAALQRLLGEMQRAPLLLPTERAPMRWRTVPILTAIAAALLLGIGIGRLSVKGGAGGTVALGTTDSADPHQINFVFTAPLAHDVALVGDFNDWNPSTTPMQRSADGREWSTSLVVPAGRHLYSFVVNDSTWVADPRAPIAPEGWYGTRSSVLLVAERSER